DRGLGLRRPRPRPLRPGRRARLPQLRLRRRDRGRAPPPDRPPAGWRYHRPAGAAVGALALVLRLLLAGGGGPDGELLVAHAAERAPAGVLVAPVLDVDQVLPAREDGAAAEPLGRLGIMVGREPRE